MNNGIRSTTAVAKFSRRALLCRMAAVSGMLFVAPALLTACGDAATPPPSPPAADTITATDAAAASCTDATKLAASDKAARTTLHYKATAPDPEKACHNCQFFKLPEESETCGGCQILQGSIALTGTCDSWVKKVA